MCLIDFFFKYKILLLIFSIVFQLKLLYLSFTSSKKKNELNKRVLKLLENIPKFQISKSLKKVITILNRSSRTINNKAFNFKKCKRCTTVLLNSLFNIF